VFVKHPIPPFICPDSRVLILGSFPSVMSRETGFYYGHPKNRFWLLLSMLLKERMPESNAQKHHLLAFRHIALWDVIQSCEIKGSSDNSIRNVKINPINELVSGTAIQTVFINGWTAGRLFLANVCPEPEKPIYILPSTSAANASYSLNNLAEEWKAILTYLD